MITDSAGQKTEASLSITILQPEEPAYTVTAIVNPAEGGSITLSLSPDSRGYHEGDMVMVTAVPEPGWIFDSWTCWDTVLSDGFSTTTRFTMPAGDVTVTADFVRVYGLSVNIEPSEGGTVTIEPPLSIFSPNAGENEYQAGEFVTVTASPAEGWVFEKWESSDVSIDTPEDAYPENDVVLTARFIRSPEVFEGRINTSMGTFSASNGCAWEGWASGTFALTLDPDESSDIVSGEVSFIIDLSTYVTNEPAGGSCNSFWRTYNISGPVTGTNSSFGGTYSDTTERPLQITLTASRSGGEVTCTITLAKTMQVSVNGVVESFPVISATVTVNPAKRG